MKKISAFYNLYGHLGQAGHHQAFLGFASASLLKQCSYIDLFIEDTGEGYQRPINRRHALDFKNYIQSPGTSTLPVAFNLRTETKLLWKIKPGKNGTATLYLKQDSPCLSLIDGQHRLHELTDVEIPLAYIAYIELDLRTEMALFNTINSKAKGISSSLTDYHQSILLSNLVEEAPHLYIARRLQEDVSSPWYKLIRYGGETTSGLKRRTSLRMMQHSVQRVLHASLILEKSSIDTKYQTIKDFWSAIKHSFPTEWENHRGHLLTKGVGLYALSGLMADWICQYGPLSLEEWTPLVKNLIGKINWRSDGPFAAISGRKGANSVHGFLRKVVDL